MAARLTDAVACLRQLQQMEIQGKLPNFHAAARRYSHGARRPAPRNVAIYRVAPFGNHACGAFGGISAYESLSRLLFGAFMPSVNLRLSKELCVIYGGPDREFTPKSGPFRENETTPGNRKMARPKNSLLNQSQRFTKTGNSAFEFFGRHLLANYNRCRPAALADNAGLSAAMEAAIKAAGATLLGRADYSFSPHGMTAVLLLSESHASIHTYPEHGACFVDLFTCGHSCSAEKFDDVMCDYLRPAEVQRRFVLRHSDGIDESSLPNLDAWRHKRAA